MKQKQKNWQEGRPQIFPRRWAAAPGASGAFPSAFGLAGRRPENFHEKYFSRDFIGSLFDLCSLHVLYSEIAQNQCANY